MTTDRDKGYMVQSIAGFCLLLATAASASWAEPVNRELPSVTQSTCPCDYNSQLPMTTATWPRTVYLAGNYISGGVFNVSQCALSMSSVYPASSEIWFDGWRFPSTMLQFMIGLEGDMLCSRSLNRTKFSAAPDDDHWVDCIQDLVNYACALSKVPGITVLAGPPPDGPPGYGAAPGKLSCVDGTGAYKLPTCELGGTVGYAR